MLLNFGEINVLLYKMSTKVVFDQKLKIVGKIAIKLVLLSNSKTQCETAQVLQRNFGLWLRFTQRT